MKNLLVAAALTALFAATPALAQRDRGGDRPDRGQAGQAAPSAPAAQTQAPPAGGNGGRERGGFDRQNRGADRGFTDRGFNRDSARGQQQSPPANPTAPPTNNADRRGGFRDNAGQAPADRGRFNQDNRIQGNRFPDNRFQGNRFQDNRGQDRGRRDFSALRRNFTAPNRFRGGFYRPPQGFYNHRWVYGEILPRSFWARDYWLSNFYDYDLPPPPPGTVWVRYGNDALLIDDFDGQIIEVVYNVFY